MFRFRIHFSRLILWPQRHQWSLFVERLSVSLQHGGLLRPCSESSYGLCTLTVPLRHRRIGVTITFQHQRPKFYTKAIYKHSPKVDIAVNAKLRA